MRLPGTYISPAETGFYYLQSRYYDPAIGRFINADSYASTGQGFLGYNMFAYCGNNPVIYVDGSGTSPFSRNLDLFDYYTIHKIVQLLCVADEGWDMEVYVKGPKGRGFLDLYDTDSNSYYEVKSSGAANKASTTTQMDKYDVALIKAKRYSKDNIISSPTRGTEMVQGSFVYGMWDIDYSIRSPGLIVYTAEYNEQRALGTAVALVIIYCVMTGNIPSAIGLAPALGCA